jgi:hypothetical protein
MKPMGRLAKLRRPLVGWPVVAPPPPGADDQPTAALAPPAPARPAGPALDADPARVAAPARRPAVAAPAPAPVPPPPPASAAAAAGATSFRDRARARRRLRYLRQTRELAFRDLGGFVFDAHRFERPRAEIVAAKLKGLVAMDRELRTLEAALDSRRELMLLREPGVTVCSRCGVIHDSSANFCPSCGAPTHGADGAGVPLGVAPRFAGPDRRS